MALLACLKPVSESVESWERTGEALRGIKKIYLTLIALEKMQTWLNIDIVIN